MMQKNYNVRISKLEIMDKRGSGILRMREAMKEWKLPEPAFEENTGYFVIKFTGPYQETVIEYKEKLNERQKKSLEYLKSKGKITTREYMEINNVSERTSRYDLSDLQKRGFIIKIGATASLKYVLSSAIFGKLKERISNENKLTEQLKGKHFHDLLTKENILIRMFDNRIEIISPGELLRPLTIEKLQEHDYKPNSRNKVITKVLLRKGIMDERGSGILRMEEAMKEWKLPEPRFEENTGYFVIKFIGPYQETVIEYKEKLNERNKKDKL